MRRGRPRTALRKIGSTTRLRTVGPKKLPARSTITRGPFREATRRNQKVFVETCIQYLLLDASLYESEGFEGAKWVMSPPLRQKKDRKALWAGLRFQSSCRVPAAAVPENHTAVDNMTARETTGTERLTPS